MGDTRCGDVGRDGESGDGGSVAAWRKDVV